MSSGFAEIGEGDAAVFLNVDYILYVAPSAPHGTRIHLTTGGVLYFELKFEEVILQIELAMAASVTP